MTIKARLAVSLIGVLAVSALFDGLFYWQRIHARPASSALADIVSVVLLVMWIAIDQRDHPEVERPFDYGFLLWIFWPPYLPYYLWRTRRGAGLWMLAGFLSLFWLGFLIQVAILMAIAMDNQFFAVPR